MCRSIDKLVENCLKEYEGGEIFFDAIDEKLRSDNKLLKLMIDEVLNNETFDYIVVSGKFGKVFKEFVGTHMKGLANSIIVVNGGLRDGNEIVNFWNNYDISKKSLIFVDDSFYLGRTRDKIKTAIKEHNGILKSTYVFYDGNKEKEENVHSFYRYYDHFPLS